MLDAVQYDAKLAEFMEIAAILEVPAIKGYLGIDVVRPDRMPESDNEIDDLVKAGIFDDPEFHYYAPSRSYTRNMYNLTCMAFCGLNNTDAATFDDGHLNVKKEDASLSGQATHFGFAYIYGGDYADDSTEGIRIGTGNAAESFEDYVLGSQIAHGDGAGEMRYWADREPLLSWDGGSRQWTISIQRYFTNHSGNAITVAEVALAIRGYPTNYVLVARDVLGSPVAVAGHELIRVNYTVVSTAFPS